ncbi:MAG: hypothetical protein NC823_02190, partial [Candidatus Omnitrophica bacterium]|nr:hypothetical protein [Candidatus Omnitrophota bacterium]
CAFHRADGSYFDILGADHGYMFSEEKKVMDGFLYRDGEAVALKELRKAHPQLAIMSECQSQWTVPYTFYTWEGSSHFTLPRAYPTIKSKLNHPLRTALWGSYTWTREAGIEPDESALVGGLPVLNLKDDWSIARIRLFTEEELFNDLPREWEKEALAYYRGKNGKWFQYRKLAYGDGYVELTGKTFKPRLVRLFGVTSSPLSEPSYIQDWPASQDGQVIGLNPEAVYPLVPGKSSQVGPFNIIRISEAVAITEFHHTPGWSVVTLKTLDGKEKEASLSLLFHQECLQILDRTGQISSKVAPGQSVNIKTIVPGGIVLLWKEQKPTDGRIRSDFIAAKGQTLANGIPDQVWCYNKAVLRKKYTLAGKEFPCVSLGTGRYRGFFEQWISLEATGKPVLKFDLGYEPGTSGSRHLPPLVAGVQLNGKFIWEGEVTQTKEWQPVEISLVQFAGKTVLLTFSAWPKEGRNVSPGPNSVPIYFGRVRIDFNPDSLEPLKSQLPCPGEILLQDDFQVDPAKNSWQVFSSPEQTGTIKTQKGKLTFEGKHYKYQYLARSLGKSGENISVQARFQVTPTGTDPAWHPGLKLYWSKGHYVSFSGGNEQLVIRGIGQKVIKLAPRKMMVTDDNLYDFWLRITLEPGKIKYLSSLDGRQWSLESEVNRPAGCQGVPTWLIIGRGVEGNNEVFQNDERWDSAAYPSYVSELLVTQQKE